MANGYHQNPGDFTDSSSDPCLKQSSQSFNIRTLLEMRYSGIMMFKGLLVFSSLVLGAAIAINASGVKQKGVLVVGIDPQFAPFESVNEKQEVVGFDADIARAFSSKLSVKIEFKRLAVESLVKATATNSVDMAISGIAISKKPGVVFSDSYFSSAPVLVVRKGNPKKITYPATSFKGLNLGVQANTISFDAADEYLKPLGAQIKAYNDLKSSLVDLKSAAIDAIITDAPIADYLVKTENLERTGKPLKLEEYGMVFKQGSDLVKLANELIKTMKTDGSYQKLLEKWLINPAR
jgi:ABC-type amino acid transport substrate-binding protein